MNQTEEILTLLEKRFPSLSIKRKELLSAHTSFKIGGPCGAMLFPASEEELVQVYHLLVEAGERPFVLGGGTNTLFADQGYSGFILQTRDGFNKIELLGDGRLRAQVGATLAKLAQAACDAGLTGLEFAHGIPGTVGGGVFMNAGAYGGEMKQVVTSVRYLSSEGEVLEISGEACAFGYRTSIFQGNGAVVLSAEFSLQSENRDSIRAKMQELAAKRREKQPLEYPSAGSAFRRPEGYFAGALIEQAGLKGFQIGGAAVSEKHAGFVINKGGATAFDVTALLSTVQQRVLENSGVLLEPEIRVIESARD